MKWLVVKLIKKENTYEFLKEEYILDNIEKLIEKSEKTKYYCFVEYEGERL